MYQYDYALIIFYPHLHKHTAVDIRVHWCGEGWINQFQTGNFRNPLQHNILYDSVILVEKNILFVSNPFDLFLPLLIVLQFLFASAHVSTQPLFQQTCELSFSHCDADGDGYISIQEVYSILHLFVIFIFGFLWLTTLFLIFGSQLGDALKPTIPNLNKDEVGVNRFTHP